MTTEERLIHLILLLVDSEDYIEILEQQLARAESRVRHLQAENDDLTDDLSFYE